MSQERYTLTQAAAEIGRRLSVIAHWVREEDIDWTLGPNGAKLISRQGLEKLKTRSQSGQRRKSATQQHAHRACV